MLGSHLLLKTGLSWEVARLIFDSSILSSTFNSWSRDSNFYEFCTKNFNVAQGTWKYISPKEGLIYISPKVGPLEPGDIILTLNY